MFDVNPLLHDKMVQKEVERFERARIEKKIAEIQKKKGITNLKQFKNLDALLKEEEELPQWNFGLEKKTYKDTLDMHSKTDFNKKGNHNISRRGNKTNYLFLFRIWKYCEI